MTNAAVKLSHIGHPIGYSSVIGQLHLSFLFTSISIDFIWYYIVRGKEATWLSPMTKAPIPQENESQETTQRRHQNFD